MTGSSRYSQHARRALNQARSLARQHGQQFVDSTHLLIGILREESSIGHGLLHDLQLDLRRTERAFLHVHNLPQDPPKPLPRNPALFNTTPILTTTLREVLTLAAEESRRLGQSYIGTEHMLLAIAHGNEAILVTLLHTVEVSPEQIRRRARRLLQEGITEISVEQAKRVARLSELSRRVLNGAEQIAARMGHKRIGLAHLLLVLARERRSVCAKVLREAGLDDNALETALSKPRPATGGPYEDVIDRAVDRAERFGSHYTGTDHLLLTLARDPRGARLLRKYHADPRVVVMQLEAMLVK
jgi:ATP-dependent Clp protease ATP-binding subunit ClpA